MPETTAGRAALALITSSVHGGHDLIGAAWDEAVDVEVRDLVGALTYMARDLVEALAQTSGVSVDDVLSRGLAASADAVDEIIRERGDPPD